MKFLLTAAILAGSSIAAGAATKQCKISIVGGSYKGTTYPVKIKNGQFVGTGGMVESGLKGCVAKKKVYGRWYHLCKNSKIIVYRREGSGWKRLAARNLKKYKHNCL
ncbi:MAG: hypothetical protein ACR2OM_04815 [Aestuariivirgaceae bacterium]